MKGTGTKQLADGFGIYYWIMPNHELLTSDDILHACGWPEAYSSGPGGRFRHAPSIRRARTRILVTQFFGWDI